MDVVIDLKGCKDEKSVLLKFGEVLVLGGPDGNIPAQADVNGKGWGINWDALNDSLKELENGGIWGTSPKFQFPLKITVKNYQEFKKNQPDKFQILMEILASQISYYSRFNKVIDYELV
jgi:hypothetical protein